MRTIPDHPNLRTHEHPLIGHKIRILRDVETSPQTFRRVLGEIAGLMTYEAVRDLPTSSCTVQTPIAECEAIRLAAPITIVPILRAGLGMTDGILSLVPEARVGHIGVQRDESTKRPVEYYEKLAKRTCGAQHVVDIFACSLDQVGMLEMKVMSEKTGGLMVLGDR